MFRLIYKELALAAHPTLYVFMLLGALILIPSYPYSITFLYGCIGPFITLLYGRETNDIYYTALLPVEKGAVVKGKCLMVVIAQLGLLIVSVPCALINPMINPNGNAVGIEANFAFYGFGLMIFTVFNRIFLTSFFKTAYKVGKAFILAIIPVAILMTAMETTVHLPGMKWLDSTAHGAMMAQLPILAAGILLYTLGMLNTYFVCVKRFAQVDL